MRYPVIFRSVVSILQRKKKRKQEGEEEEKEERKKTKKRRGFSLFPPRTLSLVSFSLTDGAAQASLEMIIGIAAAVLVVIIIAAVVAFICYRKRSQQKR